MKSIITQQFKTIDIPEGKPFKSFFPLDLQRHAGEGGEGTGAAGTGEGQGQGNDGGNGAGQGNNFELPKTEKELKKLLQSEADKRVTSALQTAQQKWESEYSQKLEQEKQEAAKLAKMSEDEKRQALLQKQENDLKDKERALQQRELKLETIKILDGKKLPIDFADLLLAEDAEKTNSNVETFEKAFRAAVDAAVTEKMKGSTPGVGNASNQAGEYGKKVAESFTKNNEELEKARQSYFK